MTINIRNLTPGQKVNYDGQEMTVRECSERWLVLFAPVPDRPGIESVALLDFRTDHEQLSKIVPVQ